MRKTIEAILAIAILVIGGSFALMLTGAMPAPAERYARNLATTIGMGTLLPGAPEEEAGEKRAAPARAFRESIVTAAPVAVEPFTDHVRAVGTGRARQSVIVAANVAGLVDEVHFRPNSMVDAGDPLVTLDREAEAIALARAEAEYEQARAVNQRYQESDQRAATFSRAKIEEVETALTTAEAALKQARFEHDRRIIRAPFGGRIGLDDITIGQHLASGAEIVRIDDISALEIEFLVPEARAGEIAPGTPVQAMSLAQPGRITEGKITATDSHIDPATRTLRVRAELPNPDQALTAGATFTIDVPIEGTPLPVVPALAVQWSREGAFVWQIRDDGTVDKVPVVIARREGDRVFVEADLDDTMLVAVEGAQKLNAQSRVKIEEAPETSGALTVEIPPLRLDTARAGSGEQVLK